MNGDKIGKELGIGWMRRSRLLPFHHMSFFDFLKLMISMVKKKDSWNEKLKLFGEQQKIYEDTKSINIRTILGIHKYILFLLLSMKCDPLCVFAHFIYRRPTLHSAKGRLESFFISFTSSTNLFVLHSLTHFVFFLN